MPPYPDPNDPDPDDDGLPNSMDDDDDGDGDPDITDDTPRPPVTPARTACASAHSSASRCSNLGHRKWQGHRGALERCSGHSVSFYTVGFTPSEESRLRSYSVASDSGTRYLDTGLNPETIYYYIFVPNGNAEFTQGSAREVTKKAPKVRITQHDINPETAIVGEAVTARLNATLDLPEGVVVQRGPLWVWSWSASNTVRPNRHQNRTGRV